MMVGVALLPGCNTLPASGPEERDILHSETKDNQIGFHIVTVNAATTAVLASAQASGLAMFEGLAAPERSDVIGAGDVLTISIFEIGSGLFAGSDSAAQPQPGSAGITTNATRENLPPMQVGADGYIVVPYVGRVRAAGRTAMDVQGAIEAGLRGRSQDPQVVVEISRSIASTVIVSGEVNKPGRVPLTAAGERLLDVIALAGGSKHLPQDMVVQLIRDGVTGEAPLAQVEQDFASDVVIQPLDRVQLIYRPKSFTVFGATRVAELPFTAAKVSLAESVARAGGPSNDRADPNAIFLFRFERPDIAREMGIASQGPVVPIIYHLDMMNTNSYFLAQHFPMRDKDLIYIANARTDRLDKFFGLIGTLFTPAIVATSVANGGSF
jgi:polysaccharide export outer membrane protein